MDACTHHLKFLSFRLEWTLADAEIQFNFVQFSFIYVAL